MSDLSLSVGGLPYPFPVVYCRACNAVRAVDPYARGFPPDVAKRKLKKSCAERGCRNEPEYMAGVTPPLLRMLRGERP